MSPLTLSMSSAIDNLLPHSLFDSNNDTPIQEIHFRISAVNQLLMSFLNEVQQNPTVWDYVDPIQLKLLFIKHRELITETKTVFQDGSKIMALLDNMEHTIDKIEELFPEQSGFNFDLERMKERVEGEFIALPSHIKTAKEIKAWLLNG
ncbi:hypothetical protein [Lonepinella koalarum]|uniref:hypothetical protein n=1 Tax=Lonepinella koalarum TaxID=53417 RepID=UPI003F6DD91D